MKTQQIIVIAFLALFSNLSIFAQSTITYGISGTDSCPGDSKPTYINNNSSSITIEVNYKTIETGRDDILTSTGMLKPKDRKRVGCSLNESNYQKKYQIIETHRIGITETPQHVVRRKIISGVPFSVTFNGRNCPDDEGWQGSNDPLGHLKCGETYHINYIDYTWTATGYEEKAKKIVTHRYKNANPESYELSIWGALFTFNENKEVISPQYGIVGRISFNGGSGFAF
jgi:hypothetical protein